MSTIVVCTVVFCGCATVKRQDGLLTKNATPLFPIGCYELPEDDADLKKMAESGINLVRCHSKADLDRVGALGMMGWIPLAVQSGPTDKLRQHIESVKDHPALAVWEGPDEIIWSFTASSRLYRTRGIYKSRDEWWKQTPNAIEYSEEQAKKIMPNIHEGIQLVRTLDNNNRPFWINEALESDMKFVRQYMDWIDITGCDIYPVKADKRNIIQMAGATERWTQISRGKPVWMVLQAFAWSELGDYYGVKDTAYPTFAESRFMAYDVIAHGAKGILYWGSHYLKSDAFRQSLYALTSELAALQPFMTAPEIPDIQVNVIEDTYKADEFGVRTVVRKCGREWLIILVNEDDHKHMGVEVTGLDNLNDQQLELLYGTEIAVIQHGELITRMQPYEVKVFSTSRKWETDRRDGRDFNDEDN
ncbi:MAG: hypothetical protein ABIH23_23835 [bacterium]